MQVSLQSVQPDAAKMRPIVDRLMHVLDQGVPDATDSSTSDRSTD
jgi:hypothetical protein